MNRNTKQMFKYKEKKSYSVIWDSIHYYIIGLVLLSLYGGKACPFVTGVQLLPTFSALGIIIGILYLLRCLLLIVFPGIIQSQNLRYFLFEVSFFVLWGIAGILWGVMVYHFHLEGMIKILFGAVVPGIYFCIEMINTRERYLIYSKPRGEDLSVTKFVSLRRKVLMFGALSIGMAGIAIVLVTYKNFIWTARNVLTIPENVVIASVLKETLFVIGTFLGLVIKLIINYSRNLNLYFYLLVNKLDQIANGNYDDEVPVFSQDEFALLINHVNGISGELKEKQKIKSMFGKMVSPSIATKLMENEELELGGFQDDVVIMFTDIRNFTTYSEQESPNAVIRNLNAFHTRMVDIIMKHQGTIDKFLGDGIMAVFGIENKENICDNAAKAAIEMHHAIRTEFSSALSAGIGLHKGSAIIGMVGSPERLEFTVVGDAVNTASRLESATKSIDQSILISDAVYTELSMQGDAWNSVGLLSLKGKEQKIQAYAYADS